MRDLQFLTQERPGFWGLFAGPVDGSEQQSGRIGAEALFLEQREQLGLEHGEPSPLARSVCAVASEFR